MPTHWTYDHVAKDSDLEQGDILKPTNELRRIFTEVHPHFCNEKYLGFQITTQSCDLVRRRGAPKARYINLAVIRPLRHVLPGLLSHVIRPFAPGKFRSSQKAKAVQLLERILNQNESSIGLFFLNEDADVTIGDAAVAMLRITVAVKNDHYRELMAARTGRLAPAFQGKLGWLVGNLYNRPASPDWADHEGGEKRFRDLIDSYLGPDPGAMLGAAALRWIDDILLQEAEKKKIDPVEATDEELENLRPRPVVERAVDAVLSEVSRLSSSLPPEIEQKLRQRLKNSGPFKRLLVSER